MQGKKRVAILVGPNFHDEEATIPRDYLLNQGIDADWVGLDKSQITGKYGRISLTPQKNIAEISAQEYDGLIIPGGGAPERLRIVPKVIEFVRDFWASGKPIGAICHGPQVLISAGLLSNVTTTCYVGISDDVKLAGAHYVDQEVCVDRQLITSRTPNDLPAFNSAFTAALTSGSPTAKEKAMDVLDALELAISREKGAKDFYSFAGESLKEAAVRNKFRYLATVEQAHYDQLSDLFRQIAGSRRLNEEIEKSEIGKHRISPELTSEMAVDLAVQAEQKAYEFYRRLAGKSKGRKVREMFEYLAAEEAEHQRLLSVDLAAHKGGLGHYQWATHWDIPPGMEDFW